MHPMAVSAGTQAYSPPSLETGLWASKPSPRLEEDILLQSSLQPVLKSQRSQVLALEEMGRLVEASWWPHGVEGPGGQKETEEARGHRPRRFGSEP